MSNSHSSPHHYHQHMSVYRRSATITTRLSPYHHSSRRRLLTSVDQPYVSRHQATITPRNYQPVAHLLEITITNISGRDLVESLLRRQDVAEDNFNAPSSPHYSQETSELIVHEDAYMEEKHDDDILLEYFKIRTHRVAASKDIVNNTIENEEICVICQAEFKHGESIGTLGCGHEYHTGCIKQWLLRKKDCPMCRAPVLRMHST